MIYKNLFIKIVVYFLWIQCFVLTSTELASAQYTSNILFENKDRITYISDREENRIPDFSHAGYRGGGVSIPSYPVVRTVSPGVGDDTQRIQNAIKYVENLPLNNKGIRGAVYLQPGVYEISDNLKIKKSGVVLRGSGSGSDPQIDTILKVSKQVQGTVLRIGTEKMKWYGSEEVKDTRTIITSEFVPVGSRNFEVENAEPFEVGDNIILRHLSSQKWLDSIDGGGTDTDPAWEEGYIEIYYNRTITGIKGNVISIDAPIFSHLDRNLSETRVYKLNRRYLVTESGVEYLRIEIETDGETADTHAENGILFTGIENAWARHVTVLHFKIAGFSTTIAKNITITNCKALEPHSALTGERRYNFNVGLFSNNILFDSVISSNARHSFISNGTSVASGIVFLNSRSIGALSSSEGHQKWSQGLLYDNVTFEDPQDYIVLALYNRGSLGSSHGWGAVHSVAWNVDAAGKQIIIQKPPTAQNYGIGNKGVVTGQGLFDEPEGYIEGTGMNPIPSSLYKAQLAERLKYGVPPDIPARLSISAEEKNRLVLNWMHSSVKDTNFLIERSSDGGNHFEPIYTVTNGELSFVDSTLAEQTYYYRVQAVDENGSSGYTYTVSAKPVFTADYIPDFSLNLPLDKASFSIETNPDVALSFSWQEAETPLNLTYTWLLDKADGDFSSPIAKIEAGGSTFVPITFRDILNLLGESHITFEKEFKAKWTVKTESKTVEKWSSNVHSIVFTKKEDSEILIEPGKETELEQNYPNPFNPVTTIRFYLSEKSEVSLEVFDLAGIKIATIGKGLMGKGYHEIQFNGSNFSSGVYIYRLKAGNLMAIRKMILIK